MSAYTIEPVTTDRFGDPIKTVSDEKANAFLILEKGTEVMRTTSRESAEAWIELPARERDADML